MDDVLLEYHWLKDVAASETGVDFGYKSFKNYKLRTLSACLLWKS